MNFTDEKNEDGVTERGFTLEVAGNPVPGVLWLAQAAEGQRPLLLIGHGGGRDKLFPPLVASARHYARALGYAVVAIDAPGHGARAMPDQAARVAQHVRHDMTATGGLSADTLALMMRWATQAVPEWRAVIDAVQALTEVGSGPVAYCGLSLGTMIGLPLLAAETRIKVAALGLVGLGAGSAQLEAAARQVSVPVEFLMQWDDELVPRSQALAMYDALGSVQKTLHANPGRHADVPPFERAGWMAFFTRHLGGIPSPA